MPQTRGDCAQQGRCPLAGEARRIAAGFKAKSGKTALLVSGVSRRGVPGVLKALLKAITTQRRAERDRQAQPEHRGLAAMSTARDRILKSRRLVIKVGSALLVDGASGKIRQSWLASLAGDIAAARARGSDVLVVSSGAIALGRRKLGLDSGDAASSSKARRPQQSARSRSPMPGRNFWLVMI